MTKKSVLIVVDHGSEEIESVTLVNVLRRAGIQATLASISDMTLTGSRNIQLIADCLLSDCLHQNFDGIFLPGGMPGAGNLAKCDPLISLLKTQAARGAWYGAICASPAVVLAPHGLLEGKKATAYPGFESKLPDSSKASQRVVVDGNCITAQSPGSAQEFALTIIACMLSEAESQKIRNDLV